MRISDWSSDVCSSDLPMRITSQNMITVVPTGENPTKLWGLTTAERVRRIARAAGLGVEDQLPADGAVVLANNDHVFDPGWLKHFAGHPGKVLTPGGVPVVPHLPPAAERARREDR